MFIFMCILFVLVKFAVSDFGYRCTTPNGVDGICWTIDDCDAIKKATQNSEANVDEFIEKSKCGYLDLKPLVCCGFSGYFTTLMKNYPKHTNFLLAERNICGYHDFGIKTIVGGTRTRRNEFPWIVLLRYKNFDGTDAGFKCSGSILNNRYILTAAHCVDGEFSANFILHSVRLGEWNISATENCDGHQENWCRNVLDCNIEQKIVHPYYNKMTGNNDIALLKLDEKFEFNEFRRPICLPISDDYFKGEEIKLTIAGWGKTDYFGEQSNTKLKVEVPLISHSDCAQRLRQRNVNVTVNMICAGGELGKDACSGDSGGPLMLESANSQWYQVGIVSKGIGCGLENVPGIYTRVSRYYRWILNSIKKYGY